MGKLKVCVYAICKNESKYVDKWINSMGEADLIVVTDTGSTDNTVEKLRKRGATVHLRKVEPWRFDIARNISLGHVPDDVDICVCTDLDEAFESGWRKKLEKAWLNHKPVNKGSISKTGRYIYNYSLNQDGTPHTQFYNFKIHQRHGFRWKCPIHEYIEYIGTDPLETIFIEGIVLNHHPDPAKSRGSYLPLLEMAMKETPSDTRMRYYLGREYMYKGKWLNCMDTLIFYLRMPNARWNEERCAAMRWIAKSCFRLNRIDEAFQWYYKAIGEAPHMRDPYIEFSLMCFELGNWPMTYSLAQEALKIQERSKTFVNMGHSWDHTPEDLSAVAAYHMRMYETAHEYCKRALMLSPNHERLRNNLDIIESKLANTSPCQLSSQDDILAPHI